MLPQMLSKINVTSENIPLNPLPLQKEGEARHRHVRLAKKATAMITVNFLQKGQEHFCVTQLDFFLIILFTYHTSLDKPTGSRPSSFISCIHARTSNSVVICYNKVNIMDTERILRNTND